jgi:hypothetical protein
LKEEGWREEIFKKMFGNKNLYYLKAFLWFMIIFLLRGFLCEKRKTSNSFIIIRAVFHPSLNRSEEKKITWKMFLTKRNITFYLFNISYFFQSISRGWAYGGWRRNVIIASENINNGLENPFMFFRTIIFNRNSIKFSIHSRLSSVDEKACVS